MGVYPVRYRLPSAYCTEIGRIVTRFALLESKIRTLAYVLMQISPKQGRVAVRLGRIEDAMTAVQDLIHLSPIQVPEDVNIAGLKVPLKELESWRDRLAHGVWVKHENSTVPVLQVTSGTYQDHETNSKIKARINPAAFEIGLIQLKQIAAKIEKGTKAIEGLAHAIDVEFSRWRRAEFQKQLRAQIAQSRRYKTKKGPRRPHESSQV